MSEALWGALVFSAIVAAWVTAGAACYGVVALWRLVDCIVAQSTFTREDESDRHAERMELSERLATGKAMRAMERRRARGGA